MGQFFTRRVAAVASTNRRLGRRIQDWGTVVVPIYFRPPPPAVIGHWAMAVVRMTAGSMILADSMSAAFPERAAGALLALATAFNLLLARDGLAPRVWSRAVAPGVPQQRNGVDCGPLAVAALFPLLWGLSWTPPSRVPDLRRTLGYYLWKVGSEAVGRWDEVVRQHTRGGGRGK
jgi:hypothetical protein